MKDIDEQYAEFQKKMEPMQEMTTVAAKAFERIARKNHELMGDLVDFAVAQVQIPQEKTTAQEVFARQSSDAKAFAEKVNIRAAEYMELAGEFGGLVYSVAETSTGEAETAPAAEAETAPAAEAKIATTPKLAAKKAPVAREAPTAKKAPVANKAPVAKKAPAVTKAPAAKKAPAVTKAPTAKKAPAVTKAPAAKKAAKKTPAKKGQADLW
jgi:chemotaxis protein histidine kinase CheA